MPKASLIIFHCLPSLLLAQSPAAKSVREVALNLAVTMTAHQMTTCAKAYPDHSQRFTNSLYDKYDGVNERLNNYLYSY